MIHFYKEFIMIKTCAVSGKQFEITEDDRRFYEKMGVPVPTLCPEERERRRISFRNFRFLYNRKCDATDKKIISMYSAEKIFPVYNKEYWWSDKWDPKSYGIDFDFNRPFFEQYKELNERVPRFSISNVRSENCGFSNFAYRSKNAYLMFGSVFTENCLYGHIVWHCKDCIDCLYTFRSELCSNSTDLENCYDVHFSAECANCSEGYFLHDCRNCKNCFGCTNLRNKQYYFFNQRCRKKEYFKKLESYLPLTTSKIKKGKAWLEKSKKEICVFPDSFRLKCEDCTGNYLYECKNVHEAFDSGKSEDSKFLYTVEAAEKIYDISFSAGPSRFCYDVLTLLSNTENCILSHYIEQSHNIEYSEFIFSSHDLFGCNGLRNAQYCILNKPYSKDEYFLLRDRIIDHMKKTGEWGEFFPAEFSPFGYNETMAQEYFPLTKDECNSRGWKWKDEEISTKYSGQKYEIPDSITDVSDDILKAILECKNCSKNYRLVRPELDFYQRQKLPIPHDCPNCRHKARMALRNPRRLFERACDKCGKEIQTTFSADRPEKVYCEACYLNAVN